ncbi:MAG: IPT/TIG domain-containing protein [Acidobacteriota bacterium]
MLLLSMLAVALASCDKSLPTSPERENASGQTAGGLAASTSSVSFSIDTELDAGDTTTFTVTVTTSETTLPTQVALSTSLGNFGTSASDPQSTTESLTLSSSSDGTSTLVTGTITFYAGVTTGTASISAVVGSTTATQDVTVTEPDALFLQTISPSFGPPTGGTTVTITGVGFPAVASTDTTSALPQVTFGGALGTVSRPTTSTELTVTTPASSSEVSSGSSLVVDVIVKVPETTTRSAQSDTLGGAFTYTTGSDGDGGGDAVPPSIRSVSPTEGANAGGDTMTINGTNFETGTTSGSFNVEVRFGSGSSPSDFDGNSATVSAVSSTAITLTVPAATSALQSQAVDILVRNKTSGLAAVAQKIFTYLGEGSVLDIDPRDAPYTGDLSDSDDELTISLSATPTADSLRVEFGDTFQANCPQTSGTVICSFSGASIVFDSIQSVTVSSCSPPSGAVTVTDTSTGESQTGPTFSYTADEPKITSVSPTSIAEDEVTSSTTLTLTGSFSTPCGPWIPVLPFPTGVRP